MEFELERKIFLVEDYASKLEMEESIKEYISKLKSNYPMATITKEFYKSNGVLVRATQINAYKKKEDIELSKETQEQELDYIREKGIKGIGENVDKEVEKGNRSGKERDSSRKEGRERG